MENAGPLLIVELVESFLVVAGKLFILDALKVVQIAPIPEQPLKVA